MFGALVTKTLKKQIIDLGLALSQSIPVDNNSSLLGDLVSNVNLGPLMAKHKAIVAKDKKAIMTSVYSKVR